MGSAFRLAQAKAFNDLDGNLLLGKALDVHHEAFLVHADEADWLRQWRLPGPCGRCGERSPRTRWESVVHDVAGRRCRSRGQQCLWLPGRDLTALETCQCLGAGALALVAVQCHRAHAILGEELSHIVGAEFGAGEHQHLAPVVLLDDVQ